MKSKYNVPESFSHNVNVNAGSLAKGIYFYKIQAGEFSEIKKLTIW